MKMLPKFVVNNQIEIEQYCATKIPEVVEVAGIVGKFLVGVLVAIMALLILWAIFQVMIGKLSGSQRMLAAGIGGVIAIVFGSVAILVLPASVLQPILNRVFNYC